MQIIKRRNFHFYVSDDEHKRLDGAEESIVDYGIEYIYPFLQWCISRELGLDVTTSFREAATSRIAAVICHGGDEKGAWFWNDGDKIVWAADFIKKNLDGFYEGIFVFACNPSGEIIRVKKSRFAVCSKGEVSTFVGTTKDSWSLSRPRRKEVVFYVDYGRAFFLYPHLAEEGHPNETWLRGLFVANGWSLARAL